MADLFDGATEEVMGDVMNGMKNTEPGTKEYSSMVQDYCNLAKVKIEMEDRTERLNNDIKKTKNEKLKNYLDIGVKVATLATWTACGLVVLKFNMSDGYLQGRDSIKIFDNIIKMMKL